MNDPALQTATTETLRDRIAISVLPIIYTRTASPNGLAKKMAAEAYDIADAMLKERDKR